MIITNSGPTPYEELQAMLAKLGRAAGGQRDHRIPRLYFMTPLGEEDESLALAEAIARARASAERMAKAVGKKLGEIAHLSNSSMHHHHSVATMRKHMSVDDWPRICDSTVNQVWDDMRAVQFIIQVSAQFRIEWASD